MHKNFLKAYSERQTRLDELLRTGRYNCVSSAVFYMILSLSSGLDAGGVMTKDHAFATINTGRELVDVETTNMYGFDPGNRKEFQDSFGKATGFAYVPVKNYRDRTAINPPELVSLILSNRIAELELRSNFSDAVPLSINREALLSRNTRTDHNAFFEDPHKDMLTRLFNYGAWLIKNGKDDQAMDWAEYAGNTFPGEEAWQDLVYAAANNKAIRLIRTRKIAEARAGLEAARRRLSADNFNALDGMVLEAELAERVNGIRNPGEAEAALSLINSTWERIPEKSREELRTTAVLKEAERLGRTGNWLEAIAWIEAAVGRYGGNSLFENALSTFRQNRVGELHNSFAALYNKRDYSGAKAFIEKALEEYPGNRQLTGDLNLVERALTRQ
jgi:tetratricopeptide (TPR) repeat protein